MVSVPLSVTLDELAADGTVFGAAVDTGVMPAEFFSGAIVVPGMVLVPLSVLLFSFPVVFNVVAWALVGVGTELVVLHDTIGVWHKFKVTTHTQISDILNSIFPFLAL